MTTIKTKHQDGSETIIKAGLSGTYDPDSLKEIFEDRNKYSIIISSSVGCQQNCKMCGVDPGTFKDLSSDMVISNVKEAIRAFPGGLSKKYVKLCFMGMGEASLKSVSTSRIPGKLLRWIMNNNYAIGVDSIDYGTILPKNMEKDFGTHLIALNTFIKDQYPTNPVNKDRSIVRLFYSLHSVIAGIREFLIPNGTWDKDFIMQLRRNKIDIIYHYTLIDKLNDSELEINELKKFMFKKPHCQLRMLRYNTNGNCLESRKFIEIWQDLQGLPNIKFQVSDGPDKRASCGMFY